MQEKSKAGADRTLVVLAGDFLGPSLLSSLDKGAGIVDILNRVGITHVCFGNHECDVPLQSLKKRISKQSKFTWVNSNMRELDEKLGVTTPEYDIVTLTNDDTEEIKRIAILGLLSNQESLYRPGAYGNAKIHPIIETTERLHTQLRDEVDFILPLTHQAMEDDRNFANHFGGTVFPIILGGHDHNEFDETVNGARIIKTGMDAHTTSIVDIQWGSENEGQPKISVESVSTTSYTPDPHIKSQVEGHWRIIEELEKAKLFWVHHWTEGEEFSTKNNRLGPTRGSTALTTMLRMGLQAQCCILNAGSIRGNSTYPPHTFFTWSDLKTEIPFTTALITLWVPGSVLEATIRHSRRYSLQNPPVANGCFLHTCNNIEYNNETQKIERIMGAPMNPHQLYLTGLDVQFLTGIDNHEPLLEWVADHRINWNKETGVPAKMVVVELFSALLWLHLGSFDELDSDGDGLLRREEVQVSVSRHFGDSSIADLVVDNVFAIADIDGNGSISPLEMMIVHLVATDLLTPPHSIGSGDDQLREAMKNTVAHVLNEDDPDSERVFRMVDRIKEKLYIGDDGFLKRTEHEKTLGKLRRRSLLL